MTGAELRRIREDLGLSRTQFAGRLGLSAHSLRDHENAGRAPDLVANAARWVAHNGGRGEGPLDCEACDGVGTVREGAPATRGGLVPRVRCRACGGMGFAREAHAA